MLLKVMKNRMATTKCMAILSFVFSSVLFGGFNKPCNAGPLDMVKRMFGGKQYDVVKVDGRILLTSDRFGKRRLCILKKGQLTSIRKGMASAKYSPDGKNIV